MITYSEPYKSKKGQGYCVDKFLDGRKQQSIEVWTLKLAYEFLESINIYVDGKLCYSGVK